MSEPAGTTSETPAPPTAAGTPLSPSEQRRLLSSFRMTVKLTAMVVMIVALLGTMVFWFVDSIFDNLTPSIRHDLEWKARHGVVELCGTADLAVVAHDTAGVARAAQELVGDPDVVALHVVSDDGPVFDHGRVGFDWRRHRAQDGSVVGYGDLLVASQPVQIEGVNVGRVYLAVSTERLQSGMRLRRTILVAGGFGVALALLSALAFVQLYIGPLLRIIADAFKKLEATTLAALESSRLKSQFLANMSHEIRTPMNGIMGVTKLALGVPVEAKVRRYLEVIDTSARGLLTIINDILDFSKMEAGKYELHPRPFDLRDVIEESIAMFAERAREKSVELVHHVPVDVPGQLVGDPDRIRQILVNLLSNAVKFTDAGEIFVRVAVEPRADKLLLKLSVRDSGCGISPAAQARLFQAFTQVDGSYVRQHGGTGLGLAIAKRLAGLMGGDVGVESQVAHGSEFWFSVLLERTAERQADTAPTFEHRAAVIEQNPRLRSLVADHMRRWGMRCAEFDSLELTLPQLERAAHGPDPFAVIVLPSAQNVEDWRQIKGIRSLPALSRTPLVLVGTPGSEVRFGELTDPHWTHVSKPVRASELFERLCLVLGRPGERARDSLGSQPRERRRVRSQFPVLVVDDNEINRFVAVEQLRELGFAADTAENGAEALEAVQRKHYAVILMDCQMPVMDGYSAAREIRRRERGQRRVPIIAVTAHALVGERDNVLAAGMDDYVAKPVRQAALERALLQWARSADGADLADQQPTVTDPDAESGPEPVLPLPNSEELDANVDLTPKLVAMFLRLGPEQLAELEAAIAAADAVQARALAHKLKGGLYAVGASRLADSIETLRTLITSEQWRDIAAQLREIAPRFAGIVSALQAAQPNPSPSSKAYEDSVR